MPAAPKTCRSPLLRRSLMLALSVTSLLFLAMLAFNVQASGRLPLSQETAGSTISASPAPLETDLPTDHATAALLEIALPTTIPELTPTSTVVTPTITPSSPTEFPSPTAQITNEISTSPYGQGTLYLALSENGYSHLFAYQPQSLPFTRLTAGSWEDITPAASPDGSRLAFASNRDGYWDLYVLDLTVGEVTRLTHTPQYDAAPSWSPDGRWLAFESYTSLEDGSGGNLDIFLSEIPSEPGLEQPPFRLTDDPAADHSPAWAPNGRQIAFVSTRSGEDEIWLADLDQTEGRFRNLSQNSRSLESHPTWSPDGNKLAWSSTSDGFPSLFVRKTEAAQPSGPPVYIGSGDWPVWSPNGEALFTSLPNPNQTYLTGYLVNAAGLVQPPLALAGPLLGLTWGETPLPQPLSSPFAQAASLTPTPDWQPAVMTSADVPAGRQRLVDLENVDTGYPVLQDLVDEAFNGLRSHLVSRAGWDLLSSLENAFVPLTTPLYPGMLDDWLYTGRAFAFNTAPVHAGWVVVMKEDIGANSYWRVYLRTRYQDGSQGRPLHGLPWNFDARSSGDPRAYEQGGSLAASIPPGYWLDFTQMARGYGWERLPALTTWRLAYPSARFNEFVLTGGFDWQTAMEEIYPPEVLVR